MLASRHRGGEKFNRLENIMSFGIPAQDVILLVSRSGPSYVYKDNKKTDERIVDREGRPLTKVSGYARLEINGIGQTSQAGLSVPDVMAGVSDVEPGQVIVIPACTVQIRGGDYGSTSWTFTDAPKIEPLPHSGAEIIAAGLTAVRGNGSNRKGSE